MNIEKKELIELSMINGQTEQALKYLNECFEKVEMLEAINISDPEMAFALAKALIKDLLK